MQLYTLIRGWRIAFGHFNLAEIKQMQYEGWKVESVVYLKTQTPKQIKPRQVAVNKHGIPILQ